MNRIIFNLLRAAIFCLDIRRATTPAVQKPFVIFAFTVAFLFSPSQKALSQGNNYEGPIGVTGIFNGNVTTACSYDPLTHSAHREITDIVVPGSIGKYPLKMTRYYNSRQQYYAQNAIGLGPGWAQEYSWLLYTAGEKVVSPHGNVCDFHCGAPVGVSESWDDGIQGPHANGGTWRLADGGKVNFNGNNQVDSIEDPYGLRTTIEYQNGRRWRITEPGGRCLIFTYNVTDPSDNTRLLTKVEAYDYYNGHRIDWVSYSYSDIDSGGRDPVTGQPIIKKMLTGVTYSDGTSATYTYRTDNVHEDQTSHKMYPLLERCDDVRYSGPMRTIIYNYQNGGPHGAITAETYPNIGAISSIRPDLDDPQDTFIETRGDGPTRSFNYTHMSHCQGNECGPCSDYLDNWPPQQMLDHYTDFQGHTTYIGYNTNTWYVTSVKDANQYTTTYTRGGLPSQGGIGEILAVAYPNNTGTIQYGYYRNGSVYDPHYLTSVTDERGNKTVHSRDPNTHKILQTDYIDVNNNNLLLVRETFSYCDQADPFQCTNNPLGQIKTHRLKNGAYVHYRYNERGLLIDKWEPTWTDAADSAEPKTHYEYYTTENSYTATDGQLVYPWMDRVKTVTGPPPNWAYTGGPTSETYEYDRILGGNGITNLNGDARPGRGLVTEITHADGKFQRFAYDAYGNKRWEDNELRNATSYTYDEYNRTRNVTRPLNGITIYTYNPTNGGRSPLLHTTNNPDTAKVQTGDNRYLITTNVYDENFRRISSSVGASTTWFHYDQVGNQDYVTDPRGSGSGDSRYTTYTDYDSRNRKWQVREPLGRTTQFYYDDKINVTRIVRPDQTTETKAYDGMNRILTDTVPKEQGVDIVTRFEYYSWNAHGAGLLSKLTDGNSNIYQFEYEEPSGPKTKMTYPDTSTQSWAYDGAHNLKSRTTVNGETQNFAYDNRNRKTGEWWDGFPADGEWRVFGYDDANHLTLAANGLGNPWANVIADVRRAYDAAGRLTNDQQTVYVNGVRNTQGVIYPTYDDDGRLTRMYVNGVTGFDYTFGYDDMRRLKTIKPTVGGVPFEYSYDLASNEIQRFNWYNRVAQITPRDELNRIMSLEVKNTNANSRLGIEWYDYYTIGRLHSVTREDNKQDQFVYYLDGELKQATYGVAASPPPTPTPPGTPTPPPGQVATPTFNPDGAYGSECAYNHTFNVTVATATSGATIYYTLDGSTPSPAHGTPIPNPSVVPVFVQSNQTKTLKAMAHKANMTDSTIKSAEYTFERDCGDGVAGYPLDNAGPPPAGPVAPDLTGTFTYTLDKAGNRTGVNGMSYTPNTINEYTLASGRPVANGNNHQIQSFYGLSYYYMRDQELTKITAGSLTYEVAFDALGRCVIRKINGDPTYYIYDGDKPVLECRSNGQVAWNLYGKGVDEILQRIDPAVNGAQAFYFQQDHEGSVTHLTNWNNGSGQIIERYRYDAFGTPAIYAPNWTGRQISSFNNRFLFTGREYAGAYVYEYRARVYHADLGRFMSEDPKLFDAGDYNLYRYCHNDPIDNVDPTGLASEATGLLESGTHDRLWEMTKWFDRSNTIQGLFSGFAHMSDRDAKGMSMGYVSQSETKMYTYSLKSQYKIGDLSGIRGYVYVWDPNDRISGQCLQGVQHLTGTPNSSTPLVRGAAIGADTIRGTAIAKGWVPENGRYIYPSKPAGQSDNHAAVFVAPVAKGYAQVLSQYNVSSSYRAPLHLEVVPTAGWHVITSPLPARTSSTSELRSWDGSIPWH